jgi:hypothetical protein
MLECKYGSYIRFSLATISQVLSVNFIILLHYYLINICHLQVLVTYSKLYAMLLYFSPCSENK